jgi:ketosteroid isomerase-like protein
MIACCLGSILSCRRAAGPDITQDELGRRTQELFDAVAAGNQSPWKKYFAEDCMYFDEMGRNMNKERLVATISPLPEGYSGKITLAKAQSHIEGSVAIFSYDLDESENVMGQAMTARYHATDTWMQRKGEWQIVAGQIFRYYEDPAAGEVEARLLADFVGTYELAPGKTMAVSRDGGQLYRQRGEGPKTELIAEGGPVFFRKGVEGRTLFRRGKDGKVDALIDRRNNEDIIWKKVR